MRKQNHNFFSPLRYPGGKGVLATFLKRLLEVNRLQDSHYIEPYAGGAGLAWSLLFTEYVRRVHINDVNIAVYSFWLSVLDSTEELCKMIRDTSVNMREYQKQRAIQNDPDNHTPLELGFSTFFLNRTNRSGIISGGVIGGQRQTGRWTIDARFNKDDLIRRVERIAKYRNRISLYRHDALKFLKQMTTKLPLNSVLFMDPPYYGRGKNLYLSCYQAHDHIQLARFITRKVTHPWLISYDDHPDVNTLYSGYPCIRYGLSYSAQSRYLGTEVMFFRSGIRIPTGPKLGSMHLTEASVPS